MIKKLKLKFIKKKEEKEFKTIEIGFGYVGVKFRGNEILEILQPGIYEDIDINNSVRVLYVNLNKERCRPHNQSTFTKDMISLRFSFSYTFGIKDIEKYFYGKYGRLQLKNIVGDKLKKYVRSVIAGLNSDEIIEKREVLEQLELGELHDEFEELGVLVENLVIVDLTYPKEIQNLFAMQLEAKIKAETELANAKTLVVAARTLKNASKMMKGDENIKFLKYLETLSKIAETGRHSFAIEKPE